MLSGQGMQVPELRLGVAVVELGFRGFVSLLRLDDAIEIATPLRQGREILQAFEFRIELLKSRPNLLVGFDLFRRLRDGRTGWRLSGRRLSGSGWT